MQTGNEEGLPGNCRAQSRPSTKPTSVLTLQPHSLLGKKKKDTLDPSLEVATIRGILGLRYPEFFAVITEVRMGRGRGGVE